VGFSVALWMTGLLVVVHDVVVVNAVIPMAGQESISPDSIASWQDSITMGDAVSVC